ncbi:DUF803-domain-containing protein [Aureobasidium pullulans]|uniref:Large ribosomal subunit protein uL5m n=1 Tax=Aureobasidium pullulans TaxID=5580 RepID=A0A4S9CQ84_AURPU|nr:DUF803-domain-containing protein [Aureobasidium pullulans]
MAPSLIFSSFIVRSLPRKRPSLPSRYPAPDVLSVNAVMLDFLHFGGLDKPNGGWHSLIGIITAIIGNILISFALNTQRYAHIRLNRQYQQDEEERKRDKRSANRDSQQERIAEEREQQNLNGNGSHAEASESDPLLPSSASTSSESTIRPNKNSTATGPKSYLKSPVWWLGIALMTVGEAGNFLAYGFAPASVVSPLGVVALVSNCLIAPLLLHEQFRIRDGLGVIVAVGGCVTVVLSASDNNPKLGPDKIWELISTWEFKTYFGITVFLMLVLMSVSSRYGHKSVMIDLGLVGLFGGYTALSTKGVASLLSNTIWHVVTFPITYLLVAVLVTTAVLQIKYLNRALQHFDSTQVIPVQFVLFTLSVIIGSAILYRDFERTTTDDAIKFFAGCALTFSGVWLITSGRGKSRQHDEEEGSEDGEAIDLLDEEHNQPEIRERHDSNTRRASLQPPSDRRLKSSHSDAPSFVITSDDTPSQPFTFEASSPLNENPWALPAPANISSIHPRSSASVAAEQNSKNPPPMHATTSAPVLPTIASQKLSPRRPTTPNRGISSPSMEHSPNALSPSHQRYRNIDVSEATPGRLNTLTQILPGPLTNTLSSSLSAIVADSLRKGIVESSPSNRRRVSGRSSRAEVMEALREGQEEGVLQRPETATLVDVQAAQTAARTTTMSLSHSLERLWRPLATRATPLTQQCRRYASTDIADTITELESGGSLRTLDADIEGLANDFDPVGKAKKRNRQLPASRYKFRPPKYYRGPLHPHQPPPNSDPASRLFEPGPFSAPRLEQTYASTFESDLMTLAYTHFPPGYRAPPKAARLRAWEGASPYYKNRPLRGPRGSDVLRLLRKPITFRNVPKLEKITIHTMVKGALDDSAHLHVAGMIMQAISNVRVTTHKTRKNVAGFGLRAGQYVSVTAELRGEDMHHFLAKVIDIVMPKIKEWKGVKGSSGDSSGNLSFGFTSEETALFPEVEVNYDMYPPKMIPGFHVTVHTTATNDRDGRLLLGTLGIPFYGKQIN